MNNRETLTRGRRRGSRAPRAKPEDGMHHWNGLHIEAACDLHHKICGHLHFGFVSLTDARINDEGILKRWHLPDLPQGDSLWPHLPLPYDRMMPDRKLEAWGTAVLIQCGWSCQLIS